MRHAPDVSVHFLDGKNLEVVRCCWAASDLFLSLVDNPQETFGLAPVEAMAAGLPVVVSDWDGYRYTVTHGVEGFRVPTLAPACAHQGDDLALQHENGLLSYQDYVGALAQHVAVNTDFAAMAIARLADDPSLRQRMGDSGRQTVQQRFDWPVIARLHHQLYAELAERRAAGQDCLDLKGQHPLRGDPFRDFAPFATECLKPETEFRLVLPLPELQHRLASFTGLDRCYESLHASPADVQRLLEQLQSEGGQPCSLSRLLTDWPDEQHDDVRLALTWLAKLGCIQWFNPSVTR